MTLYMMTFMVPLLLFALLAAASTGERNRLLRSAGERDVVGVQETFIETVQGFFDRNTPTSKWNSRTSSLISKERNLADDKKKEKEKKKKEAEAKKKQEQREKEAQEKEKAEQREKEAQEKEKQEQREKGAQEKEKAEQREKQAQEKEKAEQREKEAQEKEEEEQREKEAQEKEEEEQREKEAQEKEKQEQREKNAQDKGKKEQSQKEAQEKEEEEPREKEAQENEQVQGHGGAIMEHKPEDYVVDQASMNELAQESENKEVNEDNEDIKEAKKEKKDKDTGAGDVCKREIFFNTTILVEHDGKDVKKVPQQGELVVLAKSFLETYNTMNAYGMDNEICDEKLRKIETIEVQGMGSFERVLKDDSHDVRRLQLYHVTASCTGKNCDGYSTLFDVLNGPDKQGRGKRDLKDEVGVYFAGDSNGKKKKSCKCPKDRENRSPTVEEFVEVFNSTIEHLYYNEFKKDEVKIRETTADAATAVIELQEVACKYVEEDDDHFETEVFVDYVGLPNDNDITKELEQNLTRSFRYSYNDLANMFCDPLKRFVDKVDITEEVLVDDNRMLIDEEAAAAKKALRIKRRRRLRLRTKGKCKGCKKGTGLFQDAATRRRVLLGGFDAEELVLPFEGLGGLDKLGPSAGRVLRQGDRCFCSRSPTVQRAPSTYEFAFWYSQSKELAEEVDVVNVYETPEA